MKYRIYFIVLLFSVLIPSCSFSSYEREADNTNKTEETYIEEASELFVEQEKEDEKMYVFETNDTKYLSAKGFTLWTENIKNETSNFSDITITACKESGNAEAGFGIIFCSEKIEGKTFMLTVLINAKGYYTIGKVSEGKFSYIKGGWIECKNLYTGFGVKNTISVSHELNNNEFVLKLNGEEVEKFTSPENITFKYSYSGYVVVISDKENFPTDSVKVTFTNKYKK